jgi:hypothetical protein
MHRLVSSCLRSSEMNSSAESSFDSLCYLLTWIQITDVVAMCQSEWYQGCHWLPTNYAILLQVISSYCRTPPSPNHHSSIHHILFVLNPGIMRPLKHSVCYNVPPAFNIQELSFTQPIHNFLWFWEKNFPLAYFSKVGLCGLHAVCVSANLPC